MSFKRYYFPNTIRKVNLAMLGLFHGVQVAKEDVSGNIVSMRRVPVRFGHKQKFIPVLTGNLEANRTWFNQHLPAMGLMINSMSYAKDKVRGGFDSPIFPYTSESNAHRTIFSGTPYTLTYELAILSLHMKEMSMILEQILPWFNPYRNITIREWDFLPELTRDLKVTLTSITPSFQIDTPETEVRKVEFDLKFEVDCFFYRPILESDIIKSIHVNMNDLETSNLYTTYTYGVSGEDATSYSITADEWSDYVPEN